MSEEHSTALMALQMEQLQATQELGQRLLRVEKEVHELKTAQMRIMAFIGLVGTAVGFIGGHIDKIVTYVKEFIA